MKKVMLLFALCFLFMSCDPPQNSWNWWVKNSTEQTLKLKYPHYSIDDVDLGYRTFTLSPGKNSKLFGSTIHERTTLHFNDYFETIVRKYGEDIYWQILSEDDIVLKTWKYSDRDLLNQRFFEEYEWQKEQEPGSGFVSTRFIWTFEILPEDISPE